MASMKNVMVTDLPAANRRLVPSPVLLVFRQEASKL